MVKSDWRAYIASGVHASFKRDYLFHELDRHATKALKIEAEAQEIVDKLVEINESLGKSRDETMRWLTGRYEISSGEPTPSLASVLCPPHLDVISKHHDDYAARCIACERAKYVAGVRALRELRTNQANDIDSLAEALLCDHEWEIISSIGDPAEPGDTVVICKRCGTNRYDFDSWLERFVS